MEIVGTTLGWRALTAEEVWTQENDGAGDADGDGTCLVLEWRGVR